MYKVLFVCYGNICRSPMAEMIFKDLIYKNNKRYKFECASRATSFEEIGNPMYPDAIEVLKKNNISLEKHAAKRITKEDYDNYDYIVVMEERNRRDVLSIVGDDISNKVRLLLSFTDSCEDIEDPWYTGNFDKVFNQIYEGVLGLYNYLMLKDDSNGE